MGALDGHHSETRGWSRFSKGLGIMLLLYGLVMFIGSFTDGTLHKPLKAFSTPTVIAGSNLTASEGIVFTKKVSSIEALDAVLASAGDKVVMLDFTASWCEQCKEVEEEVFKDAAVIKATKWFLLVEADISKDTDETKALKAKLEVQGPPAMRFFRNGKEISRASRMQGPNLEIFLEKISKF